MAPSHLQAGIAPFTASFWGTVSRLQSHTCSWGSRGFWRTLHLHFWRPLPTCFSYSGSHPTAGCVLCRVLARPPFAQALSQPSCLSSGCLHQHHRRGNGLGNIHLFLTLLQAGKSEITVLARCGSLGPPLGVQVATSWLCAPSAPPWHALERAGASSSSHPLRGAPPSLLIVTGLTPKGS